MIAVEEAERLILQQAPGFRTTEVVPLLEGKGRVIAEPVTASACSPRFTNSAMDGVAVRFDDVASVADGHPVRLQVVGESRAGVPFSGTVASGQAVRISTGAMLPAGADTVIPQEDGRVLDGEVVIERIRVRGSHVRFEGEEFEAGTVLASAGTVLHTRRLSLLASQGVHAVTTFRPLRVSVLTTGTEVVPWDEDPKPFQIRNSNAVLLEHAVEDAGAQVVRNQQCPDDESLTARAVMEAAEDSDLILTSGGVSAGPHDHVKAAAEQAGFATVLWKVAQKPGKPMFVAERSNGLLIGLPGNPTASYMCFVHYVLPFLRAAMGFPYQRRAVQAKMAEPLRGRAKRTVMTRVRLGFTDSGWQAVPVPHQGSHMISSIVEADGYVLLEPGQSIEAGMTVPVFQFPEE